MRPLLVDHQDERKAIAINKLLSAGVDGNDNSVERLLAGNASITMKLFSRQNSKTISDNINSKSIKILLDTCQGYDDGSHFETSKFNASIWMLCSFEGLESPYSAAFDFSAEGKVKGIVVQPIVFTAPPSSQNATSDNNG